MYSLSHITSYNDLFTGANTMHLNNISTLGPERLLKAKEVSKLIGFNVDWIYKKIAKGEFPKPIKIGRSSRWSYLEVMEWMNEIMNMKNY